MIIKNKKEKHKRMKKNQERCLQSEGTDQTISQQIMYNICSHLQLSYYFLFPSFLVCLSVSSLAVNILNGISIKYIPSMSSIHVALAANVKKIYC